MTNDRSTLKLALGLALLVTGGFLAWWGHSESLSLGNQLSRAFTGAYSDRVMYKYIGGAVCGVLGLVLVLRK